MLVGLILTMVVLIGIGILRLRLKQIRKETPQEEARRILNEYRHDSFDGTNSCEQVSSLNVIFP